MKRALVVVEETPAHRELLAEAGELAAGVDAELVLLSMLTESDMAEGMEAMEQISNVEDTGFDESSVIEAAENAAEEMADSVFGDLAVAYEPVGSFVQDEEYAESILRIAEERDCDHIFITGRRRSPTGKAIFGDTAQSVILNFEKPVTVLTG